MVITAVPQVPPITGRIHPLTRPAQWQGLYYQKLRHLWVPIENQSQSATLGQLTDVWASNHGISTGSSVSWSLLDGGRGPDLVGDGGSGGFDLQRQIDLVDRQSFTVMFYVRVSDELDNSNPDPKLFSLCNSSNVEKMRIDWDNPQASPAARCRFTIASTSETVSLTGEYNVNTYYTVIARYDGVAVRFDIYDWLLDAKSSGTNTASGDLDDIAGGTAAIGNAASGITQNREWDGVIFMGAFWNTCFSEEQVDLMLTHPVDWMRYDPMHSLRKHFHVSGGGGGAGLPFGPLAGVGGGLAGPGGLAGRRGGLAG